VSIDQPTIPERIVALLISNGAPMGAAEITASLKNVSRTSVNRALTKLKDRGEIRMISRSLGWVATASQTKL